MSATEADENPRAAARAEVEYSRNQAMGYVTDGAVEEGVANRSAAGGRVALNAPCRQCSAVLGNDGGTAAKKGHLAFNQVPSTFTTLAASGADQPTSRAPNVRFCFFRLHEQLPSIRFLSRKAPPE